MSLVALLGNNKRGSKKASNELRKLRRQDLLELLVEQMREGERLQGTITEQEQSITTLSDLSERLKGKLDDKDVQIEHLKVKLDEKDTLIDRLKSRLDEKDEVLAQLFEGLRELTERKGVVSHAALLRLEEIAADYYLRQYAHEEHAAEEPPVEEVPDEETEEDSTPEVEEVVPEEELVEEEVASEEPEDESEIDSQPEADDEEGETES